MRRQAPRSPTSPPYWDSSGVEAIRVTILVLKCDARAGTNWTTAATQHAGRFDLRRRAQENLRIDRGEGSGLDGVDCSLARLHRRPERSRLDAGCGKKLSRLSRWGIPDGRSSSGPHQKSLGKKRGVGPSVHYAMRLFSSVVGARRTQTEPLRERTRPPVPQTVFGPTGHASPVSSFTSAMRAEPSARRSSGRNPSGIRCFRRGGPV